MRKPVMIVAALAVAGGFAATIGPLDAHHAMVMYDRLRTMTLTGTVVELQWTNPHVFLLVKGTLDQGDQPALWRLETSSPTNLMRLGGWSATALKPGDRVRFAGALVSSRHSAGSDVAKRVFALRWRAGQALNGIDS